VSQYAFVRVESLYGSAVVAKTMIYETRCCRERSTQRHVSRGQIAYSEGLLGGDDIFQRARMSESTR
jgi:hypothetical protein